MAFTFFFRDSHTLEQAVKQLLPHIEGLNKIKIWNAGCAMGPETYTFAIILNEKIGPVKFSTVSIDATDIDENEHFGDTITQGLYHYDELKRIPVEIFNKYFRPAEKDGYHLIDEAIRSRVKFTQHDLLTLKPIDSGYNLVICKNVLLHFQPAERVEVLKMYHSVLADNGILVTEQTQAMPDEASHLFKKLTTDANVYIKIK
jgi:chemotaxis protein methyltransferase CheR